MNKHRQVYLALRERLSTRKFKEGSRLPTAHSLAESFGVSYLTVHAALRDLVRDGWLVRHPGKGTFVTDAAGIKRRPNVAHLAVVMPRHEEMTPIHGSDFALSFLHGCSVQAEEHGGELVTCSLPSKVTGDEIVTAVERLASSFDGVIFEGDQYAEVMQGLRSKRIPFVVGGTLRPYEAVVHYDRENAVRQGVEHLIELGCRHLAFIGSTKKSAKQGMDALKSVYFMDTLKRHGLPHGPDCIKHATTVAEAAAAAEVLLRQSPRPQGIFVDNPLKAEGVVRAVHGLGLHIPRDITLLGYGFISPNRELPAFPTVMIPALDIGRESVVLLDQIIQGRVQLPVHRFLRAKLVAGGSRGRT
ncbi:MAG: GntR family transcriptional regulator [Kiritimatiellae bacterium]|nr:GntR family transcriptional regulator [Kiritimatiellia bacterium]